LLDSLLQETKMTLVEGTNDFSIVSKLSAAKMGYFADEFLGEFVEKPKNRAPLINWGYYIRNKSLELTFEKAVEHYSNRNEPFQVLSMGAGFDTTYFNVRKKYEPSKMTFFEIDLPSNVERKTKLIRRSPKCSEYLSSSLDENAIITDSYKLFACDLSDTVTLTKCLNKHNFDFNLPTIVLSECVITYMREQDSTKIIQYLSENLSNSAFFVYEQIVPDDGFGAFMVKHFDKIGSPIHGILRYGTAAEQIDRYIAAGWSECKLFTLSEVYYNLSEEERSRLQALEMFDEFEEFMLKANHYFVLVATKGSCNVVHETAGVRQLHHLDLPPVENTAHLVQEDHLNNTNSELLFRFGHSLSVVDGKVFMVGGFGLENANHKRLGSLVCLSYKADKITHVKQFNDKKFERLYCGSVAWNGKLFLVGGRLNPKCGVQGLLVVDPSTGTCQPSDFVFPGAPRWRHATTLLGDYLVAVGGRDVDGVRDDVVALDLNTGTIISAQLDTPIFSCSACVWGKKILVSGGAPGLDRFKETLYVITIINNNIVVEKMELNLSPRFGHTSHVVRNHLLLVGGVGLRAAHQGLDAVNLISGEVVSARLPEVRLSARLPELRNSDNTGPEKLNGNPESTEKIELETVSSNMFMLHNHQAFIRDDVLFILGGGGNCYSFGTHINTPWRLDLKLSFPDILW